MQDLSPSRPPASPELRGQLGARAFSPLLTTLLALCGALLVMRAARLLGHWLLGRRLPAVLSLGRQGLQLTHRTTVLGKLLHEGELLIPLHNLSRVERVVRYNGFGFYAGLVALSTGTYIGSQLMIDAVRGAPAALDLLAWGPLVVGLGALLDFLLVTAFDSARGHCRLRVITKDGLRLDVTDLDPPLLDALLQSLRVELENLEPAQQ